MDDDDVDDIIEDDDEDYDYDDEEDDEVVRYTLVEETDLSYGFTGYGVAAILFNGAADILESLAHTIGSLGSELSYLHNRNVDRERFVGSVEAGLERLDRGLEL